MVAKRRLRGDESGSTLVVVMILALALLISMLAVLKMGGDEAVLAQRDVGAAEAFYLAESGLEHGLSWLAAQDEYPTGTTYPLGETPSQLGDATYLVTIEEDSTYSTSTRPAFAIRSQGASAQRSRTLETVVVPQSFADFLYLTHAEHQPGSGNPVWFCSADEIDGPLHTNGQVHIMGDPIYGGEVTSAWGGPDDNNQNHEPKFMYYNGDYYNHIESSDPSNSPYDEPTFEGGYELGVSEIELPNNLNGLKSVAQGDGIYISGNYEVVLSRENPPGNHMYGYVSYRKPGKRWNDVPISSFNGVLYVNGGFSLEGTLDGQLTLATNGNITVVNDVVYRGSDDNGPLDGSDDILGMVSGSSIIIDNNAANRNNCVIHSHMMALTDVRADNYHSGSPRGTLTLHGGIVQQFRGPVGTGSLVGDDIVIYTGYEKDYHYDWRLRNMPPPGYLLTGGYTRVSWTDVCSN